MPKKIYINKRTKQRISRYGLQSVKQIKQMHANANYVEVQGVCGKETM